uniref:Uncharacterized protein n=1 Tax=Utricularia reniformis TaxID=192314 RepID=A0A1Y0B0B0_9LAMI|nr:hypothetical protein AEK19_MT0558 [Utricularia reniformis]ART30814.1 hypothetical protein AEK19_MT0558 [Utricularia reniformis]
MWSAFLPVCLLSLDGIHIRAQALLAFFTAGCITHPAPKVRSLLCVSLFTGMNRVENGSGIH